MIQQFFATSLLLLCCTVWGQVPYYNGTSWGLVAKNGKILTQPSYDNIPKYMGSPQGNDIFKVVIKDTVFLVDAYKKTILNGYDDYSVLRYPLLRIKKGKKYGVYNLNTHTCVVAPTYDMLKSDYTLSDFLYIVELNGKKSVINKDGAVLIPWDSYKKIESQLFDGKKHIIARFSGDKFLLFDMNGAVKTDYFVSDNSFSYIGFGDYKNTPYKLHALGDKKYEIKDVRARIIYKKQIASTIVPDRLLYSQNIPSERMALISVYKEGNKEGLFDLVYEEKITKKTYDSLYTVKGEYTSHTLIKNDGLYGMISYGRKEDADYEEKHITTHVTPIIFSKIEILEGYGMYALYELPNRYKCFGYYEEEEEKMILYLPTEIQKKYKL
ncbi:hypothetical protein [Aquimarina sp. I32.4]|uniref:hypothetical protein n=1 Tax=Aquimarina sp. I32.4 TaxID=2053903 RepID=UPI000CDEE314|nr:hypothetical protein [Aquimarina sp. I32.4]